ncbi:hypothetical protein HanIR_Chr13g0639221 [Helianthus annuus]|nr:hypothetical protein HanIR_Chr13g0639221 [Helianthus annuus]
MSRTASTTMFGGTIWMKIGVQILRWTRFQTPSRLKKRKILVALAEEGFQPFRHLRGGRGFCFVDGDNDFWPVCVDLKHLMMLVLAQIFMWVQV